MADKTEIIIENEEEFKAALLQIKEEIKMEFLSMTKKRRKGFFISLPIAFKWLRLKYEHTKIFRDNLRRKFLKSENYYFREAKDEEDYNADYIDRKTDGSDSRIIVTWFTDEGFKKLCMTMNKSPKAALVREYFIQIEHEYVELLEMEAEQRELFIKNLLGKIEDYDKVNKNLEDKVVQLEKSVDKQHNVIGKFRNQHNVLNHLISQYSSVSSMLETNYDNIDPDDQYRGLRLGLYEMTYGKPIHVYLVSDVWVNGLIVKKPKKKASKKATKAEIKEAEDDDDAPDDFEDPAQEDAMNELIESKGLVNYKLDMEDFEFEDITETWIRDYILSEDHPYAAQQFYFHLAKSKNKAEIKNMKYWDTLYFFDDAHYNEFIAKIADIKLVVAIPETATLKTKALKEIYIAQYESLANAHKDIAAKMAFRAKHPKPARATAEPQQTKSTLAA